MNKIRIEWSKAKKDNISQIYSDGLEYAFATKEKQLTPFVYCKDFLHDAVYAVINDKTISPYSFRYNPQKNPISLDRCYILVANSSDNTLRDKVDNCVDFLNKAEKELHLTDSEVYECEDPPNEYKKGGVFLLEGSRMWLHSPPMLSLYTLFIRVGFCHKKEKSFYETIDGILTEKIKPYQKKDAGYLLQAKDGIDRIFALGYRKFFYKDAAKNYPPDIDIMTVHNYFGIVSFANLFKKNSSYHVDKIPKYWHRKKLNELMKEKMEKPI